MLRVRPGENVVLSGTSDVCRCMLDDLTKRHVTEVRTYNAEGLAGSGLLFELV